MSISMQIQNLDKFFKRVLMILGGSDNSGTNVGKMMCNNPKLDHVNINALTKLGQIL